MTAAACSNTSFDVVDVEPKGMTAPQLHSESSNLSSKHGPLVRSPDMEYLDTHYIIP